MSTNQFHLSSDHQTLTMTSTGPRTDGTTFHDTWTYLRTSQGSDLTGLWKGKNPPPSQEHTIEFVSRDEDGVTAHNPSGATLSLSATGPRSLRMVEKQGPQTIATSTFTVSSDGKTLTESVLGHENSETMKKIYDRQ